MLKRHTTLSRFLSVPDLHKKKSFQPKSSARVLTSLENLQHIEEKEREKEEKDAIKRERQRKREEKRKLKCQGYLSVWCIQYCESSIVNELPSPTKYTINM